MRYHIDTIPIWDAVKTNSECPLCLLYDQLEQKFIEFYLGDSVMESDVRQEVNQKGFCARHYDMMYRSGHKLPLALMTYTRLNHMMESISPHLEQLTDESASKKKESTQPLLDKLNQGAKSCVVCERLDEHMERYYQTILHMVKNEQEFKKALFQSKGFCLNHFTQLIESADRHLHGNKRRVFIADLSRLQQENLQRLSAEIKWFADKFDHKNASKDWGTSRDALPRILNKLGGRKA